MRSITGMTDLYGSDNRRRRFFADACASVGEAYGYEPLQVALIERAEAYSEGIAGLSPWPEWNRRGCFFFAVDEYQDSYDETPSRTQAVLIPEGTLSVTRWLGAQLTSETTNSVLPMKIYYDVRCFRNELTSTLSNTKAREFSQFGVEVLGAATPRADVEPIAVAHEILQALGVQTAKVAFRVSSNRLFTGLAAASGMSKRDRVMAKELLDTLAECKAGKKPERTQATVDELHKMLDRLRLAGPERQAWQYLINRPITNVHDEDFHFLGQYGENEIRYLAVLADELTAAGITCEVDFCVVRSHEYYTGLTFEVDLLGADVRHVEVGGGGRYDRLLGNFVAAGGPAVVPSTGFAFGVERLIAALVSEGYMAGGSTTATTVHDLADEPSIKTHVLARTHGRGPREEIGAYLRSVRELRNARSAERVSVDIG